MEKGDQRLGNCSKSNLHIEVPEPLWHLPASLPPSPVPLSMKLCCHYGSAARLASSALKWHVAFAKQHTRHSFAPFHCQVSTICKSNIVLPTRNHLRWYIASKRLGYGRHNYNTMCAPSWIILPRSSAISLMCSARLRPHRWGPGCGPCGPSSSVEALREKTHKYLFVDSI